LTRTRSLENAWLGLGDGTFPAWKCRVVLTKFVGEAWEKVSNQRDFSFAWA